MKNTDSTDSVEKTYIVTSILFFLLGLVLFIDFNKVINFISYVLGTIIIAFGVFKLYVYYRKRINDDIIDYNEFGFGIVDVILGLLIIVLSDAFITILRFFVGGWVLLSGINRFVGVLAFPDFRNSKHVSLFLMSIVVIGLGVFIILNKSALDVIGLLIMIYAVIELIESILIKTTKIKNEIIEAEVIEKKTTKKSKKD